MSVVKPEDVKIIQFVVHDTAKDNFVILGLGSDSIMYVYNRSIGWETFSSDTE